ncbi:MULTISPECIES: 50S ribosomal protein L24 [Herbidospora]|uniref:50S ribosomal protein L24 n=1 Tax=Herbidospora TaxID=28443 RepID=UPI001929FEF1|nr:MULTISPECIES: 50S ribosomal protein L24 [Herbidospora]
MHVKKGDLVQVIAGKDKGAKGRVIAALPTEDRVIVAGVNMIKKHSKETNQGPRGAKEGGVTTLEAPIHVSNVKKLKDDEKPKDEDAK